MFEKIKSTATFLQENLPNKPESVVVLGSGLGSFADSLELLASIPYGQIPNFPKTTVQGHKGNLHLAKINNKIVAIMQGRFHYYEGYSMFDVVLPLRALFLCGAEQLFVTNAAGGLHPSMEVGDIMLISDHINLMGTNPLIGENINELGPRFPDMLNSYSPKIIERALNLKSQLKNPLHVGVYAAVSGPTFETPAEYKYLRTVGADAVGMSTVPEVIAARHMGMEVFGASVITDLGSEGRIGSVSHEEVQHAAQKSAPDMEFILKQLI